MKAAVNAVTLAAALLLVPLQSGASARAVIAARIDGAPLMAFSVDAMWRAAQAKEPTIGREAILARLIDNRLLAAAARRRFGADALSSGQRVGFARDVVFDSQLITMLRALYGQQMERDLGRLPGGIEGMVREERQPDASTLAAVFGKPGALLLGTDLDPAQAARARTVVLMRYALPDGPERSTTLYDVYRQQNVQGRVSLFAHDTDFMRQQARQELAAQYTLDWSKRRFGADLVDDLRRVLSEQADAQALLRMHGIGDDGHADSTLVDELAKTVSAGQVRQYYDSHRAQFLRIARVRARHIRLPDEATARAAAAVLANGADFADTARRHSVAPDAASGGALGWVVHEGVPGWMAQLLFAHAEGQVSPPVRTPGAPDQAAAWEIVLVEKREQGYQDVDSQSVRYVASRAIARESAAAQLAALRNEVRRKARIEVITPAMQGAS